MTSRPTGRNEEDQDSIYEQPYTNVKRMPRQLSTKPGNEDVEHDDLYVGISSLCDVDDSNKKNGGDELSFLEKNEQPQTPPKMHTQDSQNGAKIDDSPYELSP